MVPMARAIKSSLKKVKTGKPKHLYKFYVIVLFYCKKKKRKAISGKRKTRGMNPRKAQNFDFSVLTSRKWCSCSGVLFWCLFLQGWWNASSSMCSSSGMENLKYIAFWSGWLPHRSQNMVLALGPEARGAELSSMEDQAAPCGKREKPEAGHAHHHLMEMGHQQQLFFFFLVQVSPEAGGGEEGERNNKKKNYIEYLWN